MGSSTGTTGGPCTRVPRPHRHGRPHDVCPAAPAGSRLLGYSGESTAQGLPWGVPGPRVLHPRSSGAQGHGSSRPARHRHWRSRGTGPGLPLAPVAQHVWLEGWGARCEGVPRGCVAPGVPQLPVSLPSPCPQAILAALWLAASESQPPGCRDRAMPRGQWVLARLPTRLRRHATRPPCPAGMNWIEQACRCCAQCPAGESRPASTAWHGMLWHTRRVAPGGRAPCHPAVPTGMFLRAPCSSLGNDTVCTACPAGTFRAQPNTFSECQACYECDRQSELAACCAVPCHAARCCAVQRRAVPLTACLLQLSRAC